MNPYELPLPESFIQSMIATEQNPRYHGEGNVMNHTLAVLEQFLEYQAKNSLNEEDAQVLYWASLLHDVGKTVVTRWVEGKWSARGHEAAGVPIARKILMEHPEISREQRRKILMLVRWHHIPLRWMVDKMPYLEFQKLATFTDLRLIGIFAGFDLEGRICEDKENILRLWQKYLGELVPQIEEETGNYSRLRYEWEEWGRSQKNALWAAWRMQNPNLWNKILQKKNVLEEERAVFQVVMAMGLPKSGKTFYLNTHYPHHYHVQMAGWDMEKLPSDPFERQKILTNFKYHLSRYSRLYKNIVLDGCNMDSATRQEVVSMIRELKGEVHFLLFDTDFPQILRYNEASETPLSESELITYWNSWQEPHDWEAHRLSWI